MPPVSIYNRKYADYAIGVQRYNAKPFNPFKSYLILTLGTKFTATSTLQEVIEAELPRRNGYARMPYRIGSPLRVQSVNSDTNVFKTYTPGALNQDQAIYFLSETETLNLPESTVSLTSATPYYVQNPDPGSGEFQIAATPGGAVIDILSGGSEFYIAKAGAWNTTSNRYESALDILLLTAGSTPGGLSYDTSIILHSTTPWGSYDISAVDTGLDEFYTTISHQIQENDLVYFTTSSGGTLPAASGTTLTSRKTFRAKNVIGRKFKISEFEGSTVPLTSTGSGTIRVFSATGFWEIAIREDSVDTNLPIVIPANGTRQFSQQFTHAFS